MENLPFIVDIQIQIKASIYIDLYGTPNCHDHFWLLEGTGEFYSVTPFYPSMDGVFVIPSI
jgi:hypothetical protein